DDAAARGRELRARAEIVDGGDVGREVRRVALHGLAVGGLDRETGERVQAARTDGAVEAHVVLVGEHPTLARIDPPAAARPAVEDGAGSEEVDAVELEAPAERALHPQRRRDVEFSKEAAEHP